MTVIVYDHENKTIAFDSRMTCDGMIVTDEYQKQITTEGNVYFGSGMVHEIRSVIEAYENKTAFDGEVSCDIICTSIADGGAGSLHVNGGKVIHEILDFDYAIGSGADWAIAALDFGQSAKGAAEYACTKNVYCGGEIKEYEL